MSENNGADLSPSKSVAVLGTGTIDTAIRKKKRGTLCH